MTVIVEFYVVLIVVSANDDNVWMNCCCNIRRNTISVKLWKPLSIFTLRSLASHYQHYSHHDHYHIRLPKYNHYHRCRCHQQHCLHYHHHKQHRYHFLSQMLRRRNHISQTLTVQSFFFQNKNVLVFNGIWLTIRQERCYGNNIWFLKDTRSERKRLNASLFANSCNIKAYISNYAPGKVHVHLQYCFELMLNEVYGDRTRQDKHEFGPPSC